MFLVYIEWFNRRICSFYLINFMAKFIEYVYEPDRLDVSASIYCVIFTVGIFLINHYITFIIIMSKLL